MRSRCRKQHPRAPRSASANVTWLTERALPVRYSTFVDRRSFERFAAFGSAHLGFRSPQPDALPSFWRFLRFRHHLGAS
jgi:hypothetical protein